MAGARIVLNPARYIREYADKIEDWRPIFEDFGEYMQGEVQDRFEAERDPSGKKWKKLAKSTLRRKGVKKILTGDTNRLRQSIGYKAEKRKFTQGTNVGYGAVHQLGAHFSIISTRAEVKIPQRKYLGINKENWEELMELQKEHVNG